MNRATTIAALSLLCGLATTASAQLPTASKEHEILKMEVGQWDAQVSLFMGPEGPLDTPQKSKATETNRMVGDFWLVSDFQGEFGGVKFTGHGQFGFDPHQKKYVGAWIDSFNPSSMKMVGDYDAAKKTMTFQTSGVEMDGTPNKGKHVIVYGDDKRVMTMYYAAPDSGELVKVMEIIYTRAKTK